MPIKNNENKNKISTKSDEKLTHSFSFGFWLKNEILKGINTYRLEIRKIYSLDLQTVVSILPFLIGCSTFFSKRYPLSIENNLPLIQKPTEALRSNTVNFIRNNSKKITGKNQDLNVSSENPTFKSFWANNAIIINQNIFFNQLGQLPYIGTIKTLPVNQKVFFSKQIPTTFKQSSSIFQSSLKNLEAFYTNFDELPSYLESLTPNSVLTRKTNSEQVNSISQLTNPFSSSDDGVYNFKRKFQKNWTQLQTQLKKNFLTKSVFFEPNPTNLRNEEDLEKRHTNLDLNETESKFLNIIWNLSVENQTQLKQSYFLNYLQRIHLFLEPFKPRAMSGYRYPDMSTLQVEKLLLQKKFFPKTSTCLKVLVNTNSIYQQKVSLTSSALWNSKDFEILDFFNSDYFSKTSQKFNTNSTVFSLPGTTKPKLDWILPIETSLQDENFEEIFVSGVYKKNPSIFNKSTNKSFVFQELWEPLTIRSWLLISQLGFAFLSFQILKSFWDIYSRELLLYLLDLIAQTGFIDDQQKKELEILMGQREQGFRVISQTTKKFPDVVGIEKLLPELAETVWFLRNSAKNFSRSNTLPKGILFVGPPGTGKTLLAQAIAGEAQVPVLTASGSSLIEPGTDGSIKLQMLFQEARRLSPCLVFIDEIDNIAQKREQVMQSPMVDDDDEENEILEAFSTPLSRALEIDSADYAVGSSGISNFTNPVDSESPLATDSTLLKNAVQEKIFSQQKMRREQLRLLMQLLIELDGIKGRHGVVVIGATNRPEVLDPAVLRPGRFDKVLNIGLPDPEKRLEILKFYGQRLGYNPTIAWDYLAERTDGFSSADLAALMNESCLKAILSQSKHTLETIEHGIDRITTFETQKPYFSLLKNKMQNGLSTLLQKSDTDSIDFKYSLEITRLAYYQAGKIVLSRVLKNHPPIVVAYLWPRSNNIRSKKISNNLQKYFFYGARRCELEDRVVGCYAGKAAEVLFLQNTSKISQKLPKKYFKNFIAETNAKQLNLANFSDLGIEDLLFGQKLIWFMVEKWYLYSKKTAIKKATELSDDRNIDELAKEQIEYLRQLTLDFESVPNNLNLYKIIYPDLYEKSATNEKEALEEQQKHQKILALTWWQKYIFDELANVDRNFAEWFRIYLYNPQQRVLNIEWLPAETFYHHNRLLTNVYNLNKTNTQAIFTSETLEQNSDQKRQDTFGAEMSEQNMQPKTPEILAADTLASETSEEIISIKNHQIRAVENSEQISQQTIDLSKIDLELTKPFLTWTDIDNGLRDYQTHSLILQSFNKALTLLDQNRELVDRIASELLAHEILRKPEISLLIKNFNLEFQDTSQELETNEKIEKSEFFDTELIAVSNSLIRIVDQQTGLNSRRKKPHWIDFSSLQD